MQDSKPTNPKDVIGSDKLPIGLVPDVMSLYASLAFLEGASKYGRYNWRVAGVRASIYHDALRRHVAKWWNGEWADEDTGVPHLASALACIGIVLDANDLGKLTDDRPPVTLTPETIRRLESLVPSIKAKFADKSPHQYTIHDTHASPVAS